MLKKGGLLKRKIRRYVLPLFAVVVLAAITLVFCAAVFGDVVYIYDDSLVTNLKTTKDTVGGVLEEAEIVIGSNDRVDPSPDTKVTNGMEIHITRAMPVSIRDGANTQEVYTLSETVADVLREYNISYGEFDAVRPAPEEKIERGMLIEVCRTKTLEYFGDGGNLTVRTQAGTIREMLDVLGVKLGDLDYTKPPLDTEVTDGMTVEMVRVVKKTVTDETDVGYDIIEKETSSLTKGQSRIVQNGRNGVRTDTYEVVFEDEVEVSKQLISSEVTREPVNKIVEKGTAAPSYSSTKSSTSSSSSQSSSAQSSSSAGTSANGEFSYRKKLTCTATAYDLSYESCGKRPGDANYGITASGMRAAYGVVAVDPSVIPLGTRLYIESADGSWSYGYCVAGDTGSGIYGNRVDLFFNSRTESLSFGRRTVNVYIL